MSDDRTADLKWIDVHDDSEVWYWTHKFGVTKRKLVAAVREVGAHAEDVAVELDKGAAHKKSRRTNRRKNCRSRCHSHSNGGPTEKPRAFSPEAFPATCKSHVCFPKADAGVLQINVC